MDTHDNLEYVGFWARTGAAILDSLLIVVLTLPLLVAIYGMGYITDDSYALVRGPADLLISYVLPAVAVIVLWCMFNSTPGKMAVGATIVDAKTGEPPTTAQYVGRYFAYFVSMIPLFLGIIWVALDSRKQGWHDKLAGTVVVRRKNRSPAPVQFG